MIKLFDSIANTTRQNRIKSFKTSSLGLFVITFINQKSSQIFVFTKIENLLYFLHITAKTKQHKKRVNKKTRIKTYIE